MPDQHAQREHDAKQTVTIRRATREDVAHLGRLGALLVATHHAFDERRFLPAADATSEHYGRFLATQLDEPESLLLVAELGAHVVGYAFAALEGYDYLALRGPAGIVHDLLVEPAHRGRGIGRQLMHAALQELQARGAPRVVLFTADRNEEAQRLFASLGFRRTMVEMTRELEGEARD